MNYKMFVCDLDGTLLDDNHRISKENLDAIKRLEDSGIKFVVATGRSIHLMEDFLDVMQYEGPIIWSNGAGISTHDGELLYSRKLSADKVLELIEILKSYDQDYILYTKQGIVAKEKEGRMKFLYEYNEDLDEKYKIPLKIDKNLEENLGNYNIFKASISNTDHVRLMEISERMNKLAGIKAAYSGGSLLDLNHEDATKGKAMYYLADKYNIKPSEIVAIGDNENDISMLEKAHLSITMENARDEIKAKAMKITSDNNDSGVAKAINKYVIKDK